MNSGRCLSQPAWVRMLRRIALSLAGEWDSISAQNIISITLRTRRDTEKAMVGSVSSTKG